MNNGHRRLAAAMAPWPEPGAERFARYEQPDPGLEEALGEDMWKMPDVPWYEVTIVGDLSRIYDTIHVISKREARRLERRKARARKHATSRWQHRHEQRKNVAFWILVALSVLFFVKTPEPSQVRAWFGRDPIPVVHQTDRVLVP